MLHVRELPASVPINDAITTTMSSLPLSSTAYCIFATLHMWVVYGVVPPWIWIISYEQRKRENPVDWLGCNWIGRAIRKLTLNFNCVTDSFQLPPLLSMPNVCLNWGVILVSEENTADRELYQLKFQRTRPVCANNASYCSQWLRAERWHAVCSMR